MARPLPPHSDQAHAAIEAELVRLCLPHDATTDRPELVCRPSHQPDFPTESELNFTRIERFQTWCSLRWWDLRARMHRCPECGTRPDSHWSDLGPRWEDDRVAQMLGIAQYGCPRCGHGATQERDSVRRLLTAVTDLEAIIQEDR